MPLQPKSRIAIIGGGMLGLTLAYKLAYDGHKVTILEKDSDFGGLASGLQIEGSDLEKYYHHVFKSDTAFQDLLKELGLLDGLQWLPGKMGILMQGKLLQFSTAVDILKFSPLNFFNRLRLGLVSFYLQKFATINTVKGKTALTWCRKYFGRSVSKVIWEPLLYSKFGANADRISMIWLFTRIRDRASSRGLPWQDERLGYLKGSMTRLITRLLEEISAHKGVALNRTTITGYSYRSGRHLLHYRTGENLEQVHAYDRVIATIPPRDFIRLFKPPKKYARELNTIGFMGAVCIVLKLKQQLSPYYWTSVNDPEVPFVAAVEHTNFLSPKLFNNNHILYLGKYLPEDHVQFSMPDSELLDLYYKYLPLINPKFSKDWVQETHIFKSRIAQHLVPEDFKVVDYRSGIPGLFYAHFAQIFPHDRGTNYAIAEALEVYQLLIK